MLRKRTDTSIEKTLERSAKPSVSAPAPAAATPEAAPAQEQTSIKPVSVLIGIVGGFIGHWTAGGPTGAAVLGSRIAAITETVVLNDAVRRHLITRKN